MSKFNRLKAIDTFILYLLQFRLPSHYILHIHQIIGHFLIFIQF